VGESGTPHLQGFISYKKKTSFGIVRASLGGQAHLEPARGSPKQAADYCKKDGNYEEYGTIPQGRGDRSDLKRVVELVKRGTPFSTIAEEEPAAVLRYGSGISRLKQFYRPKRRTDVPEIWTLWGKTGTGKTRRVWEFADPEQLWVHPDKQWFDGYDGHAAVLFDDFDGSWFKLSYLLKLLDRYVFQVPIKGGHTWWCPSTIFITSNLHPKEWYPNAHQNHQEALLRRLTEFGTIQECHHY
jgi:hypothetical protein